MAISTPAVFTLSFAVALGLHQSNTGEARRVDSNATLARSAHATFAQLIDVIDTVAGVGVAGYSGDGFPAVDAKLKNPSGIAVAADFTYFIADTGNRVIRRVDGASGIITTYAGTGSPGYTGDGGAATVAKIHTPRGIAVDASGNVYFCDQIENVIRRVDTATGIIDTVAGTGSPGYTGDGAAATAAQLKSPAGLALTASGDVYFADSGNRVIRRIDGVSGIITTIAGTGSPGYTGDGGPATSAKIQSPEGVGVDASGNVYFTDDTKHVVRVVYTATGIIETVAGDGSGGYSGDAGPACSAQLNGPNGVTIDTEGNLYIADSKNDVIRRVDASSTIITTFAGTGSPGYSGDGGAATAATMQSPEAVATDPDGNLFIVAAQNDAIRKVTQGSGVQLTNWHEVEP